MATKQVTAFFAVAFACVACATMSAVPNDRLAASQASLRGAQEAGAESDPQARLHLKMAADELALAQKAIAEQRNGEAALLLERSRADAELAVGLARKAQAEADAQQATAQTKAFQSTP